jgi:hypothetical protein
MTDNGWTKKKRIDRIGVLSASPNKYFEVFRDFPSVSLLEDLSKE